ncbi:MAG: hypothetical protein KJ749_09775, partial [Planctomycetes bacterium]|nr:hypothetical protein [Planctomycetota bacterium]
DNAATLGGGMYSESSDPTLIACTFRGNSATEGGGAIVHWYNRLAITRCVFQGNTAYASGAYGGGGIHALGSDLALSECRFVGNAADYGGGMSVFYCSGEIANCLFEANDAVSGAIASGGAIEVYSRFDTLAILNSQFIRNRAVNYGGGLYGGRGIVLCANCQFSGNLAAIGGAFYGQDFAHTALVNCTIVGNRTFPGSASPAGVDNRGELTIWNSILWGNANASGMTQNAQLHGALWIYNSAVQGWTGGLDGDANIGYDPRFVNPGSWDDNGTPDFELDDVWMDGDYRLLPHSPSIDTGDNSAVPDGIITDLGGHPRFHDGDRDGVTTVDMGAYEFFFDCNNNGVPDEDDIAEGTSQDLFPPWGGDGMPDECQTVTPTPIPNKRAGQR